MDGKFVHKYLEAYAMNAAFVKSLISSVYLGRNSIIRYVINNSRPSRSPDLLTFSVQETRIAECCPEAGSITWQDEEAKLGFVRNLVL
jgi:hypothetical protein